MSIAKFFSQQNQILDDMIESFQMRVTTVLLDLPTWLFVNKRSWTSLNASLQGAAPSGIVGKQKLLAKFLPGTVLIGEEFNLSRHAFRGSQKFRRSIYLPRTCWSPQEGQIVDIEAELKLTATIMVGVVEGGIRAAAFTLELVGEVVVRGTILDCF